MNSRAETFRGISYTNTFTRTDEEQPSRDAETAASSLHTGDGAITNVAVRDVCPNDVDEHNLHGTVDPVTYAIVLGTGPPRPRCARAHPPEVGLQQYQPGVDPANPENHLTPVRLLPGFTGLLPGVNVVGAPELAEEPLLRCYVTAAGCPRNAAPTGEAPAAHRERRAAPRDHPA